MDNLRTVIHLFFNQVHYKQLPAADDYDRFWENDKTKRWFCQQMACLYPDRYNKESNEQLYEILKTKWLQPGKKDAPAGPFNLLYHYTTKILKLQGRDIQCKSTQLLKWRALTSIIGEDVLVTNYLANTDLERSFFAWPPFITTDSTYLLKTADCSNIDLHFHLNASSLNFTLNWLMLMNYTPYLTAECNELDKKYKKGIVRILRNDEIFFSAGCFHECIIASFIRLFLYLLISTEYDRLMSDPLFSILLPNITQNIRIAGKNLHELHLRLETARYLSDGAGILKNIDYALQKQLYQGKSFTVLTGERNILYHTFCYIRQQKSNWKEISRFLSVYLLIKQKIRTELVQNKYQIGLGNFQDYNKNARLFIRKSCYPAIDDLRHSLAIQSSIQSQNLNYLEVRLAPMNHYSKEVKQYDQSPEHFFYNCLLNIPTEKCETLRHYYIIHFIKPHLRITSNSGTCRYYTYRRHYMKQARQLISFLNSHDSNYHRIVGIDAAGNEMQSRPEIFGPCFRYIRQTYRISPDPIDRLLMQQRYRLGFTYHVGEDYADLTDGLRAITEAILFLNLQKDDRISHALALGENAVNFYSHKNQTVILHRQDRLDNLVWLYQVTEKPSSSFTAIRERIRKQAEHLYNCIYRQTDKKFNIDHYADSMLLRGDDPEIYQPQLKKTDLWKKNIHPYQTADNARIVTARKNPEARALYSSYHYNMEIKMKGDLQEEYKISREEIELIDDARKKIIEWISSLGLFIECCPTSNLLIGNFRKYTEHPIFEFYYSGLKKGTEPQIKASINTDDQGIFDTCLKNEYGVLAVALTKKYEDGKRLYSDKQIVRWLDAVQANAREQQFRK